MSTIEYIIQSSSQAIGLSLQLKISLNYQSSEPIASSIPLIPARCLRLYKFRYLTSKNPKNTRTFVSQNQKRKAPSSGQISDPILAAESWQHPVLGELEHPIFREYED
jgi:hypothetical protein